MWSRLLIIISILSLTSAAGQNAGAKVRIRPYSTYTQNDPAWKEFSDDRGAFSIMLPGTPVEAANSSDKVTRRKFTLLTKAYFMVGYQDFPADFPYDIEQHKELPNQMWDHALDLVLSQSKAKLLSKTEVVVEGHPGRLTKLELTNGAILTEKDLAVGKRIYQIIVITRSEAEATKFLDSFKLIQPVEHNPDAWKIYSSTQGRFAIMFPGTPVEADKSYDTPNGRMDARDYVVMASAEYSVFYTDFALDLEQDSAERTKFFDHMRDRVVADFNAKVLTETVISLDGHPGRMMKLAAPDGSITRSRSYAVGKRLYQLAVTTSKSFGAPDGSWFEESWATKFFDSFKLAKPE